MLIQGQTLIIKIKLLIQLVRWPNLLIIILTQYLSALCLVKQSSPVFDVLKDPFLFLVCLSTVLTAAAGYAINDYYDIKIDYLNKPERVIIGKALKRREALIFHFVISFAGIITGFFVGWRIGLTSLAAAFLLWFYSNKLKRLPFLGNLAIGLLTAASIIMINFYYLENSPLVIAYSLFGFFITLIREIIKDIEDLKGDQTFGCKTIPIAWGIRKTKMLILFLILIFVFWFLVVIVPLNIPSLHYYLLLIALVLIYFIRKLVLADTRAEFKELSRLAKLLMVLGIVSMVFFKL
jgi:4-hydroxybenzoate polyprenyltransferase